MSYLVKLVIIFPIDWRSHQKTLFFDHFLQKNVMKNVIMKKSKIDQNLDFLKSTQKRCISLA